MMEAKVCSKCKVEKNRGEFSLLRKAKDGLQFHCKRCRHQHYSNNKLRILEKNKEYYRNNKEACNARSKYYYENNKEAALACQKKYVEKNKERISASKKVWEQRNKNHLQEYHRKYYKANSEEIKKRVSGWQKANRGQVSDRAKKMRKTNPSFIVKERVYTRINKMLKTVGGRKSKGTNEYVGCTWMELARHIERQFANGMTWENKGDWHIDHIIPLASAQNVDDIFPLLHFTNLRPLWSTDNMKKSDRRTLLI